MVPFVVDDNHLKQNRYSPGKHIKIISYEKLKMKKFDAIIIFAWNFSESIVEKLKKILKIKKLLFLFQKLELLKAKSV